MYTMSFTTILGLFVAPAIGVMADKFSIRWLMVAGAVLFGGGLYALSLTQSLLQFALLFGIVMALCNQLLGPICGSATISRWFTENRGKALGLAATGSSLGGMLLPPLFANWLGDNSDWRGALQNLSYIVLLTLLPYLLLFMRDYSGKAVTGDGQAASNSNSADAALQAGGEQINYTMRSIVKNPSYWIVGITLALLFSTYSALVANLMPYLLGQGLEKSTSAQLITILAVSGLVGKILFGYAADKINLRLALSITQIAVIAGLVLLATGPAYAVICVAIIVLGLSTGGMLPVWGAILAVIFGTASYGRVMGLMMPLIVLIVMPGYSLAGYLFDQSGSYSLCFYIFSAVIALSMPLMLLLKLPSASDSH
jgi:MFS family permease